MTAGYMPEPRPERTAAEVARLVEDNLRLIGWALRKLPREDVRRFHDELTSDGLRALHQCALSYDPSRGELSTLVLSFLPRRLGALVRRLKARSCQERIRLDWSSDYSLGDALAAPEPVASDLDAVAAVRGALRCLPPKWRLAVEMRFGLGDHEPAGLEEIGAALGVSKERVRQIVVKSLERLRRRPELAAAAT